MAYRQTGVEAGSQGDSNSAVSEESSQEVSCLDHLQAHLGATKVSFRSLAAFEMISGS